LVDCHDKLGLNISFQSVEPFLLTAPMEPTFPKSLLLGLILSRAFPRFPGIARQRRFIPFPSLGQAWGDGSYNDCEEP